MILATLARVEQCEEGGKCKGWNSKLHGWQVEAFRWRVFEARWEGSPWCITFKDSPRWQEQWWLEPRFWWEWWQGAAHTTSHVKVESHWCSPGRASSWYDGTLLDLKLAEQQHLVEDNNVSVIIGVGTIYTQMSHQSFAPYHPSNHWD